MLLNKVPNLAEQNLDWKYTNTHTHHHKFMTLEKFKTDK